MMELRRLKRKRVWGTVNKLTLIQNGWKVKIRLNGNKSDKVS